MAGQTSEELEELKRDRDEMKEQLKQMMEMLNKLTGPLDTTPKEGTMNQKADDSNGKVDVGSNPKNNGKAPADLVDNTPLGYVYTHTTPYYAHPETSGGGFGPRTRTLRHQDQTIRQSTQLHKSGKIFEQRNQTEFPKSAENPSGGIEEVSKENQSTTQIRGVCNEDVRELPSTKCDDLERAENEEVPLELWNVDFFSTLENRWGSFIQVDDKTRSRSSLRIARLQVMVSSLSDIPKLAVGKSSGSSFKILVTVEKESDDVLPDRIQAIANGISGDVPTDDCNNLALICSNEVNVLSTNANSLSGHSMGKRNFIHNGYSSSLRNERYIICAGFMKRVGFHCAIVNVYALNDEEGRVLLWNELKDLKEQFDLPRIIGGDFNAVLHTKERQGRDENSLGTRSFTDFTNDLQLIDMPLLGAKFTWGSNREIPSFSRLDRFLVSTEVLISFPDIKQKLKPKSLSDHNPVLLFVENVNWGPKLFKFFNHWFEMEGFQEMVANAWDNNSGGDLFQRFRLLKPKIKEWYKACGEADFRRIEMVEEQIHQLDLKIQQGENVESNREEMTQKRGEIWRLYRSAERSWQQKSHLQWLREGDKNTRFFQLVATNRARRNHIDQIEVDGRVVVHPEEVKEEISSFFERQILDCSLIANEVVDSMRKGGEGGICFKVDFEKAYDSVDWGFLEFIMRKMGFGEKWMKWNSKCVTTPTISVLVNGSAGRTFSTSRGLRQVSKLSGPGDLAETTLEKEGVATNLFYLGVTHYV
ncbi:reverse transcriptase [Corchorus capsularis]|uniref:Reverse transcriptase n=1 Tax=Corchorus capsularis TaxID=210143 RepID=A0A1R3KA23_COCAP|nr:reverse transcriptase [Corchorus capsularis]